MFDRIWAAELGGGFGRLQGSYNEKNTQTTNVDLSMTMNLVPVYFGIRYGFDQDRLARGLSTMNPYIAINGEFIFRNEVVIGSPVVDGLSTSQQVDYGKDGIKATSAFGVSLGGGVEFDVYKRKVFLGLDLRYHMTFWTNANEFFGQLNRGGNMVTILGTASYNY